MKLLIYYKNKDEIYSIKGEGKLLFPFLNINFTSNPRLLTQVKFNKKGIKEFKVYEKEKDKNGKRKRNKANNINRKI